MFEFHEPGILIDQDLELVLVEKFPGDTSTGLVPAYTFKMVIAGQEEKIGEIRLRVGNTHRLDMYFGHIGFEVTPEFRGHRYASRSIKLLLPLIQSHNINPVWICCDPANAASRRTCELADAELIEIVDLPEDTQLYQQGYRRSCRYRLDP